MIYDRNNPPDLIRTAPPGTIISSVETDPIADQMSKTEEIRRRAEESTKAAAERRKKNRKKKGSTKTSTRQPRDLEGLREDASRAREQQRFDTLKGDRAGQRNQMILALTQMYADGRLSREDVRSAFKASGLARKNDPKDPNRQSFGQRMQSRARDRIAGQLENMFNVGASETRGMGIVQLRERMKQEIADKNLREKNRIRARRGLPPLGADEPRSGGGKADPLADAPSAGANRGPDAISDSRPSPLSTPEQQGPENLAPPEAQFGGTFQDPEEILGDLIDGDRGSKLPTARDPNAPTGRGSKLPTQAELPQGFRDPERYVPPGLSLDDVDSIAREFGPTPDAGSSFTPAERLAMGGRGAFVPTPAGESQARADRFTRQQAAARRAAGLQSLSDVDRMVNSPVGPGGVEGPNISDAELRRRNFTGPQMPLDQEISRITGDFGPTTDDMSRRMTPAQRLAANREYGRQEYQTPPGESQRRADEFTRREAIRTGQGQGALRPTQSPAITGGRDAMGRPVQQPAQPRPPMRADAPGSEVRDQVLRDAMNFGATPPSGEPSIMQQTLPDMLDSAAPQFFTPQAPDITVDLGTARGGIGSAREAERPYDLQQSPMGQNPQIKAHFEKLRRENAALAEQDRLEAEQEKRRKLEEKMKARRQRMLEERTERMNQIVPPLTPGLRGMGG
jgi:hypothetical protein